MLTVVTDNEPTPTGPTNTPTRPSTTGGSLIDEIVRDGARRMLAAALEAEVAAYIAAHVDQLDERGRRLVVRNGRAESREVLTSAGAVEVAAPRVNDKRTDEATGERRRFASAILPPWCRRSTKINEDQRRSTKINEDQRRSTKINEVLPLLYLHGLSSRDFVRALEGFLGTGSGLSAATVTRLTVQWQDEAKAFGQRDLSTADYVCLWADGIHLGVRLDEVRLCLLVMIGVRVDGTKELIALTEGYRESTGSWADLLRDHARRAVAAFKLAYGAKFSKAVAKITDDIDELLAFYDYPAEHWLHLRTTNPIESTFATVRHRTKVTKGPGSKATGLAMAFKLIEAAQAGWRAVNAPHLVALVRAGARFERGQLIERTQPQTAAAAA